MDLANLTPTSDTIEVILVHPNTLEPLLNDDSENEMSITVYAPHSKEYKACLHEQTDKRLKQAQKSRKVQVTAAELEDASVDLLARVTKEWDITFNGECPKLTVAKAKELYTAAFWVKAQLEEAINDSLDFTAA